MNGPDSDPLLPCGDAPTPERFYVAPDVDRSDVWRLVELAARLIPFTAPTAPTNERILAALVMASRLFFEAEQEIRESRTGYEFFTAEACGGGEE